ncbi:MAG: hypothetical protein QOJ73_2724 [Streptosporangiaceae bacterium]|jgi:uncharacterized membrane protein|nr:hypothetical protein [Streptosporangiaceae bacterium]
MSGGSGYGVSAWDTGSLRASDADRERAVEVLKAGYAEGRIPKDEYDTRLHHAYSVPTRGDLEQVTSQLPGGGPGLYGATAPRRTNSLAIASLACGVGQLVAWPLSTVPAIVLGHVARKQIRQTGEDGSGMALAGLILGWVGVGAIFIVLALVSLIFVVFAHSTAGG